jgi:hypothetical protein
MRFDRVLRILFILYCLEAGTLLLLVPWSDSWDRLLLIVPWPWARDLASLPTARGLTSGFGLVHLIWGAQDLFDFFRRR